MICIVTYNTCRWHAVIYIGDYNYHVCNTFEGEKMKKTNFIFIVVTVLMIGAVPAFGYFATTTISPSNQSVDTGDSFSVDINWAVNYNADPTIGIEALLSFDPSVLQVVSVTGSAAPFSNVEIASWDNTAGTIHYKASGGSLNSGNYTMATLQFEAVGAGTSQIYFNNVNQYHVAYGTSGVNGAASGASVDVTGAPACDPTVQTFTILGGSGNVGDIDLFTEASTDGGLTWGPAYLTGSHPWGYVPGTNSWISWSPDKGAGAGVGPYGSGPYENRAGWEFYDFRIRFNLPEDFTDASMAFDLKADNYAKVWVNNTYIAEDENQFAFAASDALINQALVPGLNEIKLRLGDWGGIVGMNYRIDVTVSSCEEITDPIVVVEIPNTAPTANAGDDQSIDCVVGTADVTLNGSGSDVDGDNLNYSWSDGQNVVSTNASFSTSLGGGSHTFTLTVSDGEASSSDDVTVHVTLDATAPVLALPDNMSVVNDPGVCGAEVNFNVTASDHCGVTSLVSEPASGSVFDVGTTTVNVTASDAAGNTSTGSFTVTVEDNEVPVLAEPDDMTESNDPGLCGAAVSFDVTATDNCEVASVVADPASGSFFAVGTTTVTVTATDAAGNTATSSFEVTVEDNEAPAFAAVANPSIMWPPNHKYSTFDAADFVVSVSDNCADLDASSVVITRVSSDEAEDVKGGGDGKTKNDIVLSSNSVDLRSERLGSGNGRVYTIHLAVTDEHGNTSTASAQVNVPHDKKDTAVDDGAVYEVNNTFGLAKWSGNGFDENTLEAIPDEFALHQNYPNPFNPSTSISYSMPVEGFVNLIIYDVQGSVVEHLVSDYKSAGIHQISFDASELATGTYLYVLKANGEQRVGKMLLLK